MIEEYGSTTRIRSNGTRLHPRHRRADRGGVPPVDEPRRRPAAAHPCRGLGEGADRRRPLVGARRPSVEAASADVRLRLPIRASRRADRPLRGGVRRDRERPGRDRRRAGRVVASVLEAGARDRRRDGRPDRRLHRPHRPRADRRRVLGDGTRSIRRDTRDHKTGLGVTKSAVTVAPRSRRCSATTRSTSSTRSARRRPTAWSPKPSQVTVAEVLEELAERRSTWNRMDVLRDAQPAPPDHNPDTTRPVGRGRSTPAADTVLDACIDLDPAIGNGRSSAWVGWSVAADRTGREPGDQRARPRPRGTHHHLGARRPSPTTRHRRPRSPTPTSTRPTRRRPQRSPATIGSSSSSARPGPARLACSPPPSTTSTPTAGR